MRRSSTAPQAASSGHLPVLSASVSCDRKGSAPDSSADVNSVLDWCALPSGVIRALTPTVDTCTTDRPCSTARSREMASC